MSFDQRHDRTKTIGASEVVSEPQAMPLSISLVGDIRRIRVGSARGLRLARQAGENSRPAMSCAATLRT